MDKARIIRKHELLTFGLQMTFTAFCAVCVTGVHYGTGRHYWDLQEHDISEALMVGVGCNHGPACLRQESNLSHSTGTSATSGTASP